MRIHRAVGVQINRVVVTWAEQCGVEHVHAVGRADDDDLRERSDAVHLVEQSREHTQLHAVARRQAGRRLRWDRFDLIRAGVGVKKNGLVVVGIKCVMFSFAGTAAAVAMCISVAFINAELYLAKAIVDRLTTDTGHLIPALHKHAIFLVPSLPLHTCVHVASAHVVLK